MGRTFSFRLSHHILVDPNGTLFYQASQLAIFDDTLHKLEGLHVS